MHKVGISTSQINSSSFIIIYIIPKFTSEKQLWILENTFVPYLHGTVSSSFSWFLYILTEQKHTQHSKFVDQYYEHQKQGKL